MEKDKFISVINDNRKLIFKVCYSYCPDPEDRKDLQQDIIIQLWNSFPKFDGRVKLSTWIYRVALNTAISFYRKDRKHKENTVRIDTSMTSLPLFEYDSEEDEKIALLYRYIGRLNELDKALILLFLEENSYKEIAEILGITETNVATRLSRVKKNLKEQLNQI